MEQTEILAGSNSKCGSPKFINFSSLRDKFGYFKWLTIAVLMKRPIVVNEKKKSRKLNNYDCDNSDDSDNKSKLRLLKYISYLLLIDQEIPRDLQLQIW